MRRLNRRTGLRVACGIGCGLACAFLATSLLWEPEVPPLRLSAGPTSTRRHAIAEFLAKQAAERGLTLELEPTAGSEDCLNLVKTGQLDAAIVTSGVIVPRDDHVRVLAALQSEAVHLLVRKELAQGPLARTLRGRRVNLGVRGSSEWLLAQEFLSFAKLSLPTMSSPGDVVPSELSKDELLARSRSIAQARADAKDALRAEMPDCLLVLASLPSPTVQTLLEAVDYQLMPLPGTRAFLMDNLQERRADRATLQREYLERTAIPTHCYFAGRGLPEADLETVGARLLVVANERLSEESIQRLMAVLFEGQVAHRLGTKSPREMATPFAIHPAAVAFLDRDKPLAINAAMEGLSTCLSIFGAFSAGALSLYSLLWRRRARNPAYYYAEIRRVERTSASDEVDPELAAQPGQLARCLDRRLLDLRQSLIEDICEGRIKGDLVIGNILALLREARRNVQALEHSQVEPQPRLLPHAAADDRASHGASRPEMRSRAAA